MTNTGGTAAGWYHAPGDPDGTQRYWDGAQWIGDPQQVRAVPAPAASGFSVPSTGQVPPGYGGPGAAASSAPAGYQPDTSHTAGSTPADYGQRVVAYLIDVGLMLVAGIVVLIVGGIAAAVSEVLGVIVFIVGIIAVVGFAIWNLYIRQGSTGQTIGKGQQNIRLVKDDTGQPPGGGMTFVRYLVGGLLSNVTCGVYGILDVLWPLWDQDKKRLTDKIVKMSVVTA